MGIVQYTPSPAASASSGTHDQNWYITAHGVMTAFDGPVVPDVNISECTSRYCGPTRSTLPGTPASSSSRVTSSSTTTSTNVGTSPSTAATASRNSGATTSVVTSAWSSA